MHDDSAAMVVDLERLRGEPSDDVIDMVNRNALNVLGLHEGTLSSVWLLLQSTCDKSSWRRLATTEMPRLGVAPPFGARDGRGGGMVYADEAGSACLPPVDV